MNEVYKRTALVIGEEGLCKLKDKKVVIVGVGGVGGFAAEAIARSGIKNISIVDKDVVDITNINRQIIALHSTIGKPKVSVLENRIKDINPEIEVKSYFETLSKENIVDIITKDCDYVIDAIDMVTSKLDLIEHCKVNNIPIVSAMGMGNKLDPSEIKIDDISKTSMCPLAKVIRRELKNRRIKKHKVVYSTEKPIKNDTSKKNNEYVNGSVSFVPSVAGLFLASIVVRDLLN